MIYKTTDANRKNRKRYYYENQEKSKEYSRKYHKEHKEKSAEYAKKYQVENRRKLTLYYRKRIKKMPWLISYRGAQQRCENPKYKAFHRYGGRGIRCLITPNEVKELWIRDNASKMKWPSIDRIDNDGNYEHKNCRFIELVDNVRKRNHAYSI